MQSRVAFSRLETPACLSNLHHHSLYTLFSSTQSGNLGLVSSRFSSKHQLGNKDLSVEWCVMILSLAPILSQRRSCVEAEILEVAYQPWGRRARRITKRPQPILLKWGRCKVQDGMAAWAQCPGGGGRNLAIGDIKRGGCCMGIQGQPRTANREMRHHHHSSLAQPSKRRHNGTIGGYTAELNIQKVSGFSSADTDAEGAWGHRPTSL